MASHQTAAIKQGGTATAPRQAPPALDKPVARVNGTVLTEGELLREMYAMFPYAQQHNGFPKELEPEIRRGALEMIIFQELAYQEATRRKMAVPGAQIRKAEAELRQEFSSGEEFRQFLKAEMKGSREVLREKLRRALLIQAFFKAEIADKARVTATEARQYYEQNPKQFERSETFHIQSISILPPDKSERVLKEARRRAQEAAKAAKATTSYREFGLLAERISEDDYRVNMGDHKPRRADQLPPPVVKAAMGMKPGEVSGLIPLGNAFTIVRLVRHEPAGKVSFAEAKSKLIPELQRQKTEKVRAALGEKLRKDAKIEKL